MMFEFLTYAVTTEGQVPASWWAQVRSGNLVAADWAHIRVMFPLALAGIVVWSLWLYRVVLSRRATPIVTAFRSSTSVIVPSYHEDVAILLRCLQSWLSEDPDEVIVVLDVADTEAFD